MITVRSILFFICPLLLNNLFAAEVEFDRDIRPIFSDNCFACHGPDANTREADLRLDSKESVFQSDSTIVVPRQPHKSELYLRIISDDPDMRMPPTDSKRKRLSKRQSDLIRKWIEQGAVWGQHWAFVKPTRPQIPITKMTPLNEVDAFVFHRQEIAGVVPSKVADRVTLIRRLSFDLTGLPPTPKDVDTFVRDNSDDAYEKLIERLLESPHYGERMAMYWLDVVRYADSNGYHSDEPRSIAPYRDYVVAAFNKNTPYDQFVIEQLAGDLLPNPTTDQKIASGFNMLLQTTSEGGAQAKEYLAKYSADRVRNTSSIFLGVTMGCAECHDHKFDPFTMKDFYSFAAFFADIKQVGVGNPQSYPVINRDAEDKMRELDQNVAAMQKRLAVQTEQLAKEQSAWEQEVRKKLDQIIPQAGNWHVIGPFIGESFDKAYKTVWIPQDDVDLTKTYGDLKWTPKKLQDGAVHPLSENSGSATYLYRTLESPKSSDIHVSFGSDDAIKVWLNGKAVLDKNVRRGAAPDQEKLTLSLKKGTNRLLVKIVNDGGGAAFYFSMSNAGLNPELVAILNTALDQRSDEQRKKLAEHFQKTSPELKRIREQVESTIAERKRFVEQLPTTLMTVSVNPMQIRILPRGNWLDDSGQVVPPQVPHFLSPLDESDRRANRLDLAKWMVDHNNPLTARTFVNRLWKLFFGQGLTTPLDDLGAQGTRPTHPALLDWLAVEFMESGWNVKHIVRLLVSSRSYQQVSYETDQLRQSDPFNQLYARQSRFRLDAEMVRDNALAISGLLSQKIGGRSVKPYQPAGYWRHMNFPVRRWKADTGESLYRRGLYTWWQRMFLHPSLLAFDAPSREECTVERPRSNTPQQALVLLNDPTYVEAARVFAEQMLKHAGNSDEDRLDWAFRKALSRPPRDVEIQTLKQLARKHLKSFQENPKEAVKLLSVGVYEAPDDIKPEVLAAWTSVTRVILNLHETITRR